MVNNFPVNGKLRPSKYLDYLIDSSFQGVNRLFFVFSFQNEAQQKRSQPAFACSTPTTAKSCEQ